MHAKEKRFVEELLDASLRNYSAAEPRLGLEGRVLAGVRARQRAERRRAAWFWAAGLAGVAAMATLLVISLSHRQPAPVPAIAKVPTSTPAPMLAKAAPAVPLPVARPPQHSAAPRPVEWRPQQFPTPRPLSEQEKLLVAYVEALEVSTTPAAPKIEQAADSGMEVPALSVAAIKIEPLSPEEDTEGN